MITSSRWWVPLLGALAAASCKTSSDAKPLAEVDGRPITREAYYRYLERKPSVSVLSEGTRGVVDAKVAYPLGFQALTDLVNRRMLEKIAERDGLLPGQIEVDRELATRQKEEPQFVKRLEARGLSLDEIKDDLKIDLITERLWTKGVEVDDYEVQRYIDDHPDEFVVPATAELQWLVVETDAQKKQVDAALAAGEAFAEVAARLSVVPGPAEKKAQFPERRLDRMPPSLRQVVEKTRAGASTDWIRDGSRWARFHVRSKTESRKVPMDDALRDKLKRLLAVQKGRSINDLGKLLKGELERSQVVVHDENLRRLWDDAKRQAIEPSGR